MIGESVEKTLLYALAMEFEKIDTICFDLRSNESTKNKKRRKNSLGRWTFDTTETIVNNNIKLFYEYKFHSVEVIGNKLLCMGKGIKIKVPLEDCMVRTILLVGEKIIYEQGPVYFRSKGTFEITGKTEVSIS